LTAPDTPTLLLTDQVAADRAFMATGSAPSHEASATDSDL